MNPDALASVAVIVPARNEEDTIVDLIRRLPYPANRITIVDNGSSDRTAILARSAGARVVPMPVRGYGRACLAGVRANPGADVLLFIDADLSENPEDAALLVEPISRNEADLVLGARTRSSRPWHARVGTALCVWLINRLWDARYTDLGPFRAIRRCSLDSLNMQDETWGWTIEMQVKGIEAGLRCVERPIFSGPRRGGRSKISGTVSGTVRAAGKMLLTIARLRIRRGARPGRLRESRGLDEH
jgi:hypothetical protein